MAAKSTTESHFDARDSLRDHFNTDELKAELAKTGAIVREKALLWGAVCLVYALAVLGLGFAFNPALSAQHLERFAVVIIGVPIFAAIGASLGVFACDPLAQLVQRRVRPSYLYL